MEFQGWQPQPVKTFDSRKKFLRHRTVAKTGARACGGYQAAAEGRGGFDTDPITTSNVV